MTTTNPESNAPTPDDLRLEMFLRPIDADGAPIDADALEQIRALAASEFDRSAGEADSPELKRLPPTAPPSGRNIMKLLAVLASSAAVLFFLVFPDSQGNRASQLAFGEVLERTYDAGTLQLRLIVDGESSEVWVQQPGLVRWEDAPARYRIARGSRLWRIDANDQIETEADNPWRMEDSDKIDLLALLDVRTKNWASLREATPAGVERHAGKDCYVYRHDLRLDDGRLKIEAFVDAETNLLVSLTARNPAAPATGPPLAELTLLALAADVPDDLFVVPMQLASDGRIGKIGDLQGLVALRPLGQRRWTPLCRDLLLSPGDWIRTDVRGANAATIKLTSQIELIVAPGSLLELISPTEARLHDGAAQVRKPEGATANFLLRAPKAGEVSVTEPSKTLYRVANDQSLAAVAQRPVWLEGYEGTSTSDSLGSLIVEVEGRNESLTVGEHHVSVEIRDQIARTTIEETFVNHTNNRLEGIFHFPLPQDASISGFGMWIGNELVEADVVEKQRAREIYETILREKRDPGLLEWTGGNIFKARVFPIEAHSEKRIKIVYTQVLPLRGKQYRYSYALKSEMLATHPLRELTISTLVSSAAPLKSVESPTHPVRTELGKNSARLDFAAQEYTPTRDFEVVCEVDQRENDVVVIPHRRGDDGYFLMQLTPPTADGNWRREVIPDGEPLELLVLCDTSGSMDSASRRRQTEFVAALLAALGDRDRFDLAVCDVDTAWTFGKFVEANDANREAVSALLDERISLGWTDLGKAFAATTKRLSKSTQVIYVGDGIVTTATSDPSAFATQLRKMFDKTQATFHAVSLSSSFESVVLKGIASIGRGSTRAITDEQTPTMIALELLNELAQPGLKDVRVEFRGVRVAKVYPEQLPNIAAGTQQILVGRYLPEGQNQRGEVIVSGVLNGQPVKYVARIEFPEAEEGNSFIPRLWARSHLESLLMQGSGPFIQDEIIALSEEFHIITPYTSLLVLESDADRERFGVKRRFEMRDGERFFVDGRNEANYELRRMQMQRAAQWRLELRQRILAKLMRLGRNPKRFETIVHEAGAREERLKSMSGTVPVMLGDDAWFSPNERGAATRETWAFDGDVNGITRFDRSSGRLGELNLKELGVAFENAPLDGMDPFGSTPESLASIVDRTEFSEGYKQLRDIADDLSPNGEREAHTPLLSLVIRQKQDVMYDAEEPWAGLHGYANGPMLGFSGVPVGNPLPSAYYLRDDVQYFGEAEFAKRLPGLLPVNSPYGVDYESLGKPPTYRRRPDSTAWFARLFPTLPPALKPEKDPPPVETKFDDEAIALSKSLLRTDALKQMAGGIEIRRTTLSGSSSWDRLVPNSERIELYSPGKWATRDFGQGQQRRLDWLDAAQRGVLSESLRLGQVRPAAESDGSVIPLVLVDFSIVPLHEAYRSYAATVERPAENRAVLVLTSGGDPHWVIRMTIDTERNVLLAQQSLIKPQGEAEGKVNQTTTFDEFVEVAGSWWATKITSTNATPDDVGYVATQTIVAHDVESFDRSVASLLAPRGDSQLLTHPLPKIEQAKRAVARGAASFEDRMILLLYNSLSQKWEAVFAHLSELEKLAGDKPGMTWIRIAVEASAGRNEEARQRLVARAETFEGDDLWLATHLLDSAYPLTDWNEYGRIVTQLKPVYERQADVPVAVGLWNERWASVLSSLGRNQEWLEHLRMMAESQPGDPYKQAEYGRAMVGMNRFDEGLAWLLRQLEKQNHWRDWEVEHLRSVVADIYEERGRWEELLGFLEVWVAESSAGSGVYARYLTALIYNDRGDDADRAVADWVREGTVPGKIDAPTRARLDAAVSFMLGSGHRIYHYYGLDAKWRELLRTTALACAQTEDRFNVAANIIGNYHFAQTDEADRIRGVLLQRLLDEGPTLPQEHVAQFASWVGAGRLLLGENDAMLIRQVETAEWERIAALLLKRWEDDPDPGAKHQWQSALMSVYGSHFPDRVLPMLRRLVAEGHKDYVTGYRQGLFNHLLGVAWTEEIEAEAFALLGTLSDSEKIHERLRVWIPALHRFVDATIARRNAALRTALQDEGQTSELTPNELAEKYKEFRTQSLSGAAERLRKEINGRQALDGEDLYLPWLEMEAAWIDIQLDQRRAETLQLCWNLLGDAPVFGDPKAELEPDQAELELFAAMLRERALTTVMNFAARKNAEPELVARVLAYLDAGIAGGKNLSQQVNAERDEEDHVDLAAGWKSIKYELLIALDRADDLEAQLRQWIRDERWTISWRLSLARLLAERGKLDEAVTLFEAVKTEDALSSADEKTLSDWYLALDRRAQYERSRIDVFKAMQEHQLSQFINQQRYRLQNAGGPHELDETTLFALRALFEKTNSPGGYYWQTRELYTTCRDFRVLQMIPETILGRSRQQVYDALGNLQGSVLHELRKEATADEMLKELERLRAEILAGKVPRGADPNERAQSLDLRALDLLEAMIERQSSEVLNQPGPHVVKALAALRRSFDRDWAEGERRQMASLLVGFGAIARTELAQEQQRQLLALHDASAAGSVERARIAYDYARVLFYNYNRRDEGLTFMESAAREFTAAHDGQWPQSDVDLLFSYSNMLQGAGRYSVAESTVEHYRSLGNHAGAELPFVDHFNSLHDSALRHRGRTSLGEGRQLYDNLKARLLSQCDTRDDHRRYTLIAQLIGLHEWACTEKYAGAKDELRAFTNAALPALLEEQVNNYASLVTSAGDALMRQVGALDAFSFLLDRVENYPARFRYRGEDPWSQHGYRLAEYRHTAWSSLKVDDDKARLTALEARLLPLVLVQLRLELEHQRSNRSEFFRIGHNYFWPEKTADFERTAEDVLRERRHSPRTIVYTADYLYHGLHKFDRAIEVMFTTHRRGLLDDGGLDTLIGYLQNQQRYAESIALLEPYLDRHPGRLDLRTRLMLAYHHAKRPEQLTELIAATDAYLHAEGRWQEGSIAHFAQGCLDAGRPEPAAKYYTEAIDLRRRYSSGSGDGTLSNYSMQLASAYSQLKQTKPAIDAAASAIVSWGNDRNNRTHAIGRLLEVMRAADDLDEYVAELDAEAEKTGQDSPILRKALGQTYQSKNQFEAAVKQFQLALELQPTDREVHQYLLACFDALQDNAGAVRQLLAQIDFDRHNLALYTDLAKRTKDDDALAERAATSIVESAPNEAETHQALAQLRGEQGRWNDAVAHWERVAELRRLEPTGLLGLADANREAGRIEAARENLKQLRRSDWPSHFGDVNQKIRDIEAKLPKP